MTPFLNTDYLEKLTAPAGSAFVAFLFWIVLQFVFKLDFKCPCDSKKNTEVCVVYMTLPTISLFIVMMITDKHIRSICCSSGRKIQCKSIVIIMSLIRGVSVASLWMFTLLMNGDWYACLETKYFESLCKFFKTPAEVAEIRLNKSLSREYAIVLLFCVSILWIFTAIRQTRCMQPLVYQYNTHFLEKTDLKITEELKQLALGKAKKEGVAQIRNIKPFLRLNVAITQQQQSEGQANQNHQPDQSSDRCNTSSEYWEEPADSRPLL